MITKFSTNQPDARKQYLQRPGAYAIIKNQDGLIAIVKTKTGYFLPGGGMEKNETQEECLKRECLEEIGAEISITNFFAEGNYYFHSTTLNIDMESIGYFFNCEIIKYKKTNIEDGHELLWMDTKTAIELMYLANQKEAIKIFYQTN
jgi:8-oxo-dGTP diphosphatase